jgi:hypothetical protein
MVSMKTEKEIRKEMKKRIAVATIGNKKLNASSPMKDFGEVAKNIAFAQALRWVLD